jgi:FMN phosphatase YigB (HAD superfamily)
MIHPSFFHFIYKRDQKLILTATKHLSSYKSKTALSQAPTLSNTLFDYFASSQPFELLPGAKETLKKLKCDSASSIPLKTQRESGSGVIVGVVSNSDPRTALVLKSLGLGNGLIDFVV